MNLFELIWFLIIVACGWFLCLFSGHKFGIPGYILGFILGAAVGFSALWVLVEALSFVENLLWGGIPRLPLCKNGTCSKKDYTFEKITNNQYVWRCKCGLMYRKRGRRFLEVDAEGRNHAYLTWIPFKGWKKES